MRFKSGKHANQTLEGVLLKKPDFAQWYMESYPQTAAAREFGRLIRVFNAKPFTARCNGCRSAATRASTYQDNPSLMFWCDDCTPHSSGAERRKVTGVTSVSDVLQHIDLTANGNRDWKRTIVRKLAAGKGLPKRLGERQALAFFETT